MKNERKRGNPPRDNPFPTQSINRYIQSGPIYGILNRLIFEHFTPLLVGFFSFPTRPSHR